MNKRKPKKILTQSNGLPIYQLYIWIHDIHPIIWRRILVCADSTIEDLHYTLQIAFGWEDLHLNVFHIHGQQYGVYHDGGISFMTDPKRVKLSDFNFYHNERFRYEYDFGAGWVHEIRVEAFLETNDKYSYPYCQQGQCKAPPEDCGGAFAFMEQRDAAPRHLYDLFDEVIEAIENNDLDAIRDYLEEINTLREWLTLDDFNRSEANHRLQHYAQHGIEHDYVWRWPE